MYTCVDVYAYMRNSWLACVVFMLLWIEPTPGRNFGLMTDAHEGRRGRYDGKNRHHGLTPSCRNFDETPHVVALILLDCMSVVHEYDGYTS